jgi:hypothetical protein
MTGSATVQRVKTNAQTSYTRKVIELEREIDRLGDLLRDVDPDLLAPTRCREIAEQGLFDLGQITSRSRASILERHDLARERERSGLCGYSE